MSFGFWFSTFFGLISLCLCFLLGFDFYILWVDFSVFFSCFRLEITRQLRPAQSMTEQPGLTQTFGRLQVLFLFTRSNWVECESTQKTDPTQPMDSLNYGFGWVIWCCFQNKCGSILANIKMKFKIDGKYATNCELRKESEL